MPYKKDMVPPFQRFTQNFEPLENGCWQWRRGLDSNGYAMMHIARKSLRAHCYAYLTLVGPIPTGQTLDHLCRNRACVNPDHLEPVTRGENVLRGVGPSALEAKQTHCLRGHPLTPDNLERRKDGKRQCTLCRRIRANAYYRQHKEESRAVS